jgi:hypothetical protein
LPDPGTPEIFVKSWSSSNAIVYDLCRVVFPLNLIGSGLMFTSPFFSSGNVLENCRLHCLSFFTGFLKEARQ